MRVIASTARLVRPSARARLLRRRASRLILVAVLTAWAVAQQFPALPNRPDSLKFAVIGDNGTGDDPQYEVARQMAAAHATFPFDLVIMLGDNMYGGQDADDFVDKFEKPYAPLLAAGVTFQATLGNHDHPANVSYKLFNMGGRRYYTFVRKNVRFVVLDSTQMDTAQLQWAATTLREAREDWKICYFHHPLYSSAKRHGASVDLRVLLEPIFVLYGVNAVFSGHDHVYERIKPQRGIYYFVSGAAGQLRKGDVRPDESTAAYFDQDRSFMLVEISGPDMFFTAVSRTGRIVDSGAIHRQARTGRARDRKLNDEPAFAGSLPEVRHGR